MGLNSSKYIQRSSTVDFDDDDWAFASKSLMDDSERFKNVDAFLIPPRQQTSLKKDDEVRVVEFQGLLPEVKARVNDEKIKIEKRVTWSNLSDDAKADTSVVRVDNQMVLQTRKFIRHYYQGCMQCDDAACGAVSRHLRLANNGQGFACVVPGCRGTMFPTYDAKMLFDQLQYFEALVDVPRAERKRRRQEEKKRRDAKRSKQNDQENKNDDESNIMKLPPAKSMRREDLAQLRECIHSRIDQSAYNWIKPDLWKTVFTS